MKVIIDMQTEDEGIQNTCLNKVRQFVESAKETGYCLNVWERARCEVCEKVEKKSYGWKICVWEIPINKNNLGD